MKKLILKRSKKNGFSKIIVLVIMVSVAFIVFNGMKSLSENILGIGKEINVEKKTPLFTKNTYSSVNAGYIEDSSMKLLKVKDSWRYVQVENGKKYWIPPKEDNFDFGESVILDVPVIGQFPELYNGCEAMSTLMILEYNGIHFEKTDFADMIPKDETKLIEKGNTIVQWGNPKVGFVGDITGVEEKGYSIDPEPLIDMLESEKIGEAVNLSGVTPSILENYIRLGSPIAVWITMDFQEDVEYITWETKSGEEILGTFSTHAMTLVGFDSAYYYLNDPYSETKNYQVGKDTFENIWKKRGRKAITVL